MLKVISRQCSRQNDKLFYVLRENKKRKQKKSTFPNVFLNDIFFFSSSLVMFYYNIDMNLKSRMGVNAIMNFFFFCFGCDLDPTVYFGVYLHENLFKRNDAICCICVIDGKKYGKLYTMQTCVGNLIFFFSLSYMFFFFKKT